MAKIRKILALALLGLILISSIGYAAEPENALSSRSDDSIYFVLKLGDTARFLKWLLSSENIRLIMPLILGSKSSNSLMGTIEIISAVIENTPLRSAALVIGMDKSNIKLKVPFFQMAFTVNPTISYIVRNIAKGSADASDIAKLILGDKNPLTLFAETMIKTEREKDNIFRINNEFFLKAADDLVILGTSLNDVSSAVKALEDSKTRLFAGKSRKFATEDYVLLHVDYNTASLLEHNKELDDLNAKEFFDKPLEIEFAFKRFTDKFLVSIGLNLREALKKKFADKIAKASEVIKAVKGGNIDQKSIGGSKSPLGALGTYLDLSRLKDSPELKSLWDRAVREVQKRFGVTEDEVTEAATGPFSVVVNDSVMFEGFKVPALYISQTGKPGAAGKIYDKLTKSPHFSKVQDGVLQIDSSLSPISCLVVNRGDTLGIDFAELTSLAETPDLKPALTDLLNREAVSAFWVDFVGVRDWLLDDSNGVFAAITPLATFMGYGRHVRAVREILSAEFSVPSLSIWSESPEVFYTEFSIADINPEEGVLSKLVKLYLEFNKK